MRFPVLPWLGVALLVCAGPSAAAEESTASTASAEPSTATSANVRLAVEWIGAARFVERADPGIDPANALGMPRWSGSTELRPNLRVESGAWQLVARPRLLLSGSRATREGAPALVRRTATASWTEAFVTWRPADALAVSAGRQNFQWGPAELLAPSNRLFHESGLFRDPLYLVRGKDMLRVNVSLGRQWSLVALADLHDSGDGAFVARAPFRPTGLAKFEYTSADGASYAGLVAGRRSGVRSWIGEYAALTLSDAWTVYLDAAQERGSDAWVPAGMPPVFTQARAGERDLRGTTLAGVRWTLPRGDEWRLEAVHQAAGWTRGEIERAPLAAVLDPAPLLAPGLEFAGRDLVLLAVRVPDLPPRKRTQVSVRYLHSVTDGSGVLFATAAWEAADAWVVFGSATWTRGPAWAEFSRLVRTAVLGGVVRTW